MSDLDLYVIHNLDRRAPSPDLAAQLTAQLNTATDQITRQRLDVARTILGDPQRRQAYDAQLSDPQAPPITEATLAALAGRPTPAQAKPAPFAQPRVLAAVAAALGVLLVIVVSAVACSGGDDDGDSSRDATPGAPSTLTTKQKKSAVVYNAEYRYEDASFVPGAFIRVDGKIDLESTARKLGWTGKDFDSEGGTQVSISRIKSSADLELSWCDPAYAGRKDIKCFVITVSPDLRLLSDAVTSQSEAGTRLSKEPKIGGKSTFLRVSSTGTDQWPTDAVTVKNGETKLSAPALVSGANAGTAYFIVPGSFTLYRGTAVWG